MAEALLSLRAVSAAYGRIQALCEVSVDVPEGEIVALLGSNGAGKTTTLNCISNLVDCTHGEVRLDGERIDRLGSDALVKRGIVQVPEGRQVFRDMSVRENLDLGATCGATARASAAISRRCTRCSRVSRSASTRWPPRSRAANSRCWPSAAQSWRARA